MIHAEKLHVRHANRLEDAVLPHRLDERGDASEVLLELRHLLRARGRGSRANPLPPRPSPADRSLDLGAISARSRRDLGEVWRYRACVCMPSGLWPSSSEVIVAEPLTPSASAIAPLRLIRLCAMSRCVSVPLAVIISATAFAPSSPSPFHPRSMLTRAELLLRPSAIAAPPLARSEFHLRSRSSR